MVIPLWIVLALQACLVNQLASPPVPPTARVEREAWVMGTRLQVIAEGPLRDNATAVTETVVSEIERFDRLLSTWDSFTELSHVNRADPGRPVPVSPELAMVLSEAEAWAQSTGRAFDPTLGALIDVWALRGEGARPTLTALASARAVTGPGAVEIDTAAGHVTRHSGRTWLDPGAFGKGAALRSAAHLLLDRAVERVLIDLGGQIWATGTKARPWRVFVAHPNHRDQTAAHLQVFGVSVATSGTSERWVEVAGQRLGHILDPRTGIPAPAWGTVTVVSADPFEADVLSTALYVMGPELGMDWIRRFPQVGVLFLEDLGEDLKASWNPAMEQWFANVPQVDIQPKEAPIMGRKES